MFLGRQIRRFGQHLCRQLSSSTSTSYQLQELRQRGLIRIRGDDTVPFLQGLITNDMNHLVRGNLALYAMFLNNRGRIMYESIVYKTSDPGEFLLECDSQVTEGLIKHLKLFRVRRKIDITPADNEKRLWVIFDPREGEAASIVRPKVTEGTQIICTDPRIKKLGTRLILDADKGEDHVRKELFPSLNLETAEDKEYRRFCYRIGIAEGIEDIPPGKCFPLEYNADFLHGVSFHKGCYVGQELTARTHHTGVVRKRLMPVKFPTKFSVAAASDLHEIEIRNETEKSVGKLRGVSGAVGIALLRIDPALAAKRLVMSNGIECSTEQPVWWPAKESPLGDKIG